MPARRERTHILTELFEELDFRDTRLGDLVLRRRSAPSLGGKSIYEVILDGQFLMSSLVNYSEIALVELGLAPLEGDALEVIVGGLGLGYSADTALANDRVSSLLVVECLADVIRWHREGLVPLGEKLCADERCRIVHGDFFALIDSHGAGVDSEQPGRRFDAILVDIDHSTDILIHGSHTGFYKPKGLRKLLTHLKPGGVFALWSAERPAANFVAVLDEVFASHEVHEIAFNNPLLNFDDINTVYVARAPGRERL